MSHLDQAKREATRLFKLAKKESNSIDQFKIEIKNLSYAKEIVANINGYPNWNSYEKELHKKDSIEGKDSKREMINSEKEILSNIDYFNKDIPFIFNRANDKEDFIFLKEQSFKTIKLGDYLEKEFSTMKEKFLNKNKDWKLTSYPMTISGGCGSGKTESLLSLSHQYIENGEGLIYLEGKGDISIYSRLFNMAIKNNRINDLYLLNFLNVYKKEDKISHTIDPINPLIGDETAFQMLFGDKIGILIHELAKCIKNNNGLVSIQNIESFLILNNIKSFKNDNLFLNATPYIDEYLESLSSDDLKEHASNCKKAFSMIDALMEYSHLFSIDPEIDLRKAFAKRKVVLFSFPALEKMGDVFLNIFNLMLLNIHNISKKYESLNKIQNLIIDDATLLMSNSLSDYIFSDINNNMNVIHSVQDFSRESNYIREIINNSKTFVLMKSNCSYLPNQIKLKIMDNLVEFPPFYKNRNLQSQQAGQAMVFGHNDSFLDKKNNLNYQKGWTFSPLKMMYYPVLNPEKYIYLNKEKI